MKVSFNPMNNSSQNTKFKGIARRIGEPKTFLSGVEIDEPVLQKILRLTKEDLIVKKPVDDTDVTGMYDQEAVLKYNNRSIIELTTYKEDGTKSICVHETGPKKSILPEDDNIELLSLGSKLPESLKELFDNAVQHLSSIL